MNNAQRYGLTTTHSEYRYRGISEARIQHKNTFVTVHAAVAVQQLQVLVVLVSSNNSILQSSSELQ